MKQFPLQKLSALPPTCIANIFSSEKRPKGGFIWEFVNELKPIDLYCYLWVRFGQPNGLQNLFRNDSSDNLIHWEWTLACDDGIVLIQEHNFRTEVHCIGDFQETEFERNDFVNQIKMDFSSYGKEMSRLRRSELERWVQFINPYKRVASAIDTLAIELENLNIDPESQKIESIRELIGNENKRDEWRELSDRYSRGMGICFGIKAMLPVMAESFVNMLIFLLVKNEIKADPRLFDNAIRQAIDIRIKSLGIICHGFDRPIDYSHNACKQYNTLVNERNDLLHGNFTIDKLTFDEVYFNRKVPVFIEYRSFWEKSWGFAINAVGFNSIKTDIAIVNNLISYLLSCLNDRKRAELNLIMEQDNLGYNIAEKRIGILFPDRLVDFRMQGSTLNSPNAT